MEKSMVQDLSSLYNSHLINNRSTFITTTLSDADNDFRKSRIQNLPGYRKENLGDKLNFIVVFQVIEIERLSMEIQSLRVALKDAELQAFNVSNYEVQIRELTERCFCYDQERDQYREQNDKLNMVCRRMYEELQNYKNRFADIDPAIQEKYEIQKKRNQEFEEQIGKWKARIQALQRSKDQELEDMRALMESQRKSMLDREIKQVTFRFSSERQLLDNQIRKLRDIIKLKDQQAEKLSIHISRIEIQNDQLRNYESIIGEYEDKFALIYQQTMRLNDALRQKHDQVERLEANAQMLTRRINELEDIRRQTENKNRVINQYQEEMRSLQISLTHSENQKKRYESQLSQIPYLQNKVRQFHHQSQSLKDAHRVKLIEIQDWKKKYQNLIALQKEKEDRYKQQIPAFQNRIQQLLGENERINHNLRNRAVEIEASRNKNQQLQRKINYYVIIEEDKKKLEQQFNKLVRKNQQLRSDVNIFQQRTKNLQQLEMKLTTYEQQKLAFLHELQRLNSAIRSLSEEKQKLEKKNQNLEISLKNFINIQQQMRIHQEKEIKLTKQIDKINGLINEKIKEIQKLKEHFYKIENSLQAYKVLEKKMMQNTAQTQNLLKDLDDSRKQASFFHEKYITAQSAVKNLTNQIYIISQEKDQVIKIVNRKTRQFEILSNENQELKSQIQKYRKIDNQYCDLQEKYKRIEHKIMQTERKLQKQQLKSFQLNNSLEKALTDLNKIKREGLLSPSFKQQFNLLKMQFQKKDRDFKQLAQRCFIIENILRKFRLLIGPNEQMNKRNHQKWINVNNYLEKLNKSMKKTFQMQSQILRLQEENMNLQSRLRMANYEIQNQNLKKSFASSTNLNSVSEFNNRKVSSTVYFDNSFQTKVINRRSTLEPLSFRQNRQKFQFQLT